MIDDVVVQLMRDMLWISLLLMLPPLAVALVLGFVIGLLQAITSIQEQTLSFVPKIIGICAVLVLFGSWMVRMTAGYTEDLFARLAEFGAL